jgi:type IV secretory pathway VirB3-like protein
MAIPFHKAINSIESIHSSIRHDRQVYRWFVKFISHPSIKARLQDSHEDKKRYAILRKITAYKIGIYILLAILLAIIFFTRQNILFLLGIPILLAIYKLSTQHKKNVAEISCSLLMADRETIKLESQTLYQICEYYGKTLSIPTLVDIIANQDDILRKTLIYTCVVTCFIYPFDFWNNWFIIFAAFFLVQAAINTPLVFDRLK